MGDPFKKVQSGDRLRIPATAYNRLMDVARDHQADKQNTRQKQETSLPQPGVILTVRNDSGSDCDRFEVLGLDSPVFEPTDNTADFSRGVVMDAKTPDDPTHRGSFVVLLEPIADGAVGRAIVQGAAYVQVDITGNDVDEWADIEDAETGNLKAGVTGSAKILWRASSATGVQWCVCLLGAKADNQVSASDTDGTRNTLRDSGGTHKLVGDNESQITEVYEITGVSTGASTTVAVAKAGNIVTGSHINITGIVGTVGGTLNGNSYYVTVAGNDLTLYADADRLVHVDTAGQAYTSDGTVSHGQDVSAGNGWIDFVVLGADETNQQLLARHKHTGERVKSSGCGSGCGVLNMLIDAGHIVAFSSYDETWSEKWYDAFTGEQIEEPSV